MKLFTNEGFSFTLQVTSLILLIGYSASKSGDELPYITNIKAGKIYPFYFQTENKNKLYAIPLLTIESSKNRQKH